MNQFVYTILGLLLLPSCGYGTPIGIEYLEEVPTSDLSTPPPVCGQVLSVVGAPAWFMAEAVLQAMRWEKAIGCPITFADPSTPNTVPVVFQPELYQEDGSAVYGITRVVQDKTKSSFQYCVSIQISNEGPHIVQTFTHELGHCLGAVQDPGGHTETGIMKAYRLPGGDSSINEQALDLICASVPCNAYSPEK